MLVNAMFYQTVPDQPMSGGLNVGPFTLTPEQMGIGLVSNLIVFPPSLLIVFLFRKARPRVLRESRIDAAIKRTVKKLNAKKIDKTGTGSKVPGSSGDNMKKVERKKRFTLPWWCSLVAWVLVAACLVVSVFFLFSYGIMFGQSKATKWITSLAVSFFSSVLLVQPLKIFLITIFVSAVCKKTDLDEDDVEDDELSPELDVDHEWLHDHLGERQKLYHRKIDPSLIEKLRKKRLNEKEMYAIILELLVYVIFISVLLSLTYSNRDPNAFLLRENLRHSLIHEGRLDNKDFTQVTNTDKLWAYLHFGFFQFLRADKSYNGASPYQLKGFMNDQVNRIMGYATIRQIRAKKFTCSVPPEMRSITLECSANSGLVNEESTSYCAHWLLPTNDTRDTDDCQADEFRYATATELRSLPIWGKRDWYGGGGYVIRLRAKTDVLLERLTYLQQTHWIDRMTRAVLIEFSTYNAGTNLFGVATLIADFIPGGGIFPTYRVDGVRLLQHQGDFNLFTYLMEASFVLFVAYFTVMELRLLVRLKKKYFENYWSYVEIGLIVAGYSAIVLYVLRYLETAKALAIFNATWGNSGYPHYTRVNSHIYNSGYPHYTRVNSHIYNSGYPHYTRVNSHIYNSGYPHYTRVNSHIYNSGYPHYTRVNSHIYNSGYPHYTRVNSHIYNSGYPHYTRVNSHIYNSGYPHYTRVNSHIYNSGYPHYTRVNSHIYNSGYPHYTRVNSHIYNSGYPHYTRVNSHIYNSGYPHYTRVNSHIYNSGYPHYTRVNSHIYNSGYPHYTRVNSHIYNSGYPHYTRVNSHIYNSGYPHYTRVNSHIYNSGYPHYTRVNSHIYNSGYPHYTRVNSHIYNSGYPHYTRVNSHIYNSGYPHYTRVNSHIYNSGYPHYTRVNSHIYNSGYPHYTRVNSHIYNSGILSATLSKCWDDLSSFMVAFLICFGAFVFLFYMILNCVLTDFSDIVIAVETCFSMLLGKFDFDEMKEANAFVPMLFFVFVMTNSVVLINLLFTIIIQAFELVKHDLHMQPNEYEIVDFVWQTVKTTLGLQTKERMEALQTTSTVPEDFDETDKLEVSQLPDKMDKFLEHVNSTYFNGSLDLRDKVLLGGQKGKARLFEQGPRRRPYVGGE
ncbi:uncharacterized protein LOC108680604 [Hyalella azteca]|uniref:Uncharacterized protein LOC108680604 n=1 Tax=Hyalella azteca TaxID=294128 RepID=A0A979FUS4_HYAAZ|nr:uncharacterized protein LOC108680604 [Hyalella azteca]